MCVQEPEPDFSLEAEEAGAVTESDHDDDSLADAPMVSEDEAEVGPSKRC